VSSRKSFLAVWSTRIGAYSVSRSISELGSSSTWELKAARSVRLV